MSVNDILDKEFNITNEEITGCNTIEKALEIIKAENPYSKLPENELVTAEELFPEKEKSKEIVKKDESEMTISELMEEEELDSVAENAELAYKKLLVAAMNSSPKCMAEIASVASSFLDTKMKAVTTKVENRLKRKKLELEKMKAELKVLSAKANPDDDANVVEESLPTITIINQ